MTSGVVLLVKPPGCSSHDVVGAVRRRLGVPCGHLGTLDPLAAGLLVVAAGQATRLVRYAEGQDKSYVAEIWFGLATASEDFAQPAVATADAAWLSEGDVRAALAAEGAEALQVPPAYSARQVDGERAYRAARHGRALDLPARPAAIREATILSFAGGARAQVRLALRVSAGYYVRALARDLGRRLGLPAVLAALLRTGSGAFLLDQAQPLEEEPVLWPAQALVAHLPQVSLDAQAARRISFGQRLPGAEEREGRWAVYHAERLVAIVQARQGVYHPETVLAMEE